MTQTAVRPIPQTGQLAKTYCNLVLPLEVLQSASGFYIGTQEEGMSFSRESAEYFRHRQDAVDALNTGEWTQRDHP